MRFASWNINSVNIRSITLLNWLIENNIDVICIQEIKCQTKNFPFKLFESKNYFCEVLGQKSYNGVAIISNKPIKVRTENLPLSNEQFIQSRYLEVEIENIIFSSIYVPNGNPINSPKFEYKLLWMENLISHIKSILLDEKKIILAGDFNVIPEDIDCWNPDLWRSDALAVIEVRKLFRKLIYLGFYDAFRSVNDKIPEWTFWDYQNGAWNKDFGIRIDHLVLNSLAIDSLKECKIDKSMRGIQKPSDHVPIWGEILN